MIIRVIFNAFFCVNVTCIISVFAKCQHIDTVFSIFDERYTIYIYIYTKLTVVDNYSNVSIK